MISPRKLINGLFALITGKSHKKPVNWSELALIIFDFDGVFTDNMVYVDQDGRESVRCSREDSLGLAKLKKTGIPFFILSTETNPVVAARGRKLGMDVFQGCEDKRVFLSRYLEENAIDFRKVAYVGNDVNDLQCMRLVGIPVCPSDAHPEILSLASVILRKKGGCGAIRELCDMVMADRMYENRTKSSL